MNAAVLEAPAMTTVPAIAAVLTHSGPQLIDFDETIYFRNSTEDFIDSARPAVLALIAMRILDLVKPWRWTGGDATRDVWRVRSIMLLFPWTVGQWARRARTLAAKSGNAPLIAAILKRSQLKNAAPVAIATLGFESIVAPLIAALGLAQTRLIAARSSTCADRRDGKLRMIAARLGNEAVRRSLVLTDSHQDDALLDACAVPLRVEWPQARFHPAFSNVYLPGQYLTQVKRPGERYIARGILQEDFALWVLASIGLAAQPVAHVAGLLFLLLSFWSVYETGYVDNDRVAARFEHEPKLSGAFGRAEVATPKIAPWIWAVLSGGIGVVFLRGVGVAALYGFAEWLAMLLATSAAFHVYNRFDKATRIWWYCGLQLARSAAFVALVPIHLVGAMAIGAHVLAKWVPYYLYRIGGKNWPDSSHFLSRLLFFVLLSILIAVTSGFSAIGNWSAAALLAWNIFRARHELMRALLDASRIDRTQVARAPFDRNPPDRSPFDKPQESSTLETGAPRQ